MTGVWNWIKFVGVVVILILFLMLRASNAEKDVLETKLNTAERANKTSQATIDTLTDENHEANQILVERQKQHNQAEAQLDADIEELKQKLADKKCYSEPWPDDVALKLREPY